MTKKLKLNVKLSCVKSTSFNLALQDIFQTAARKYPQAITDFCGIDATTEHQLSNFGPCSAWLMYSPFDLSLRFNADRFVVVIHRKKD